MTSMKQRDTDSRTADPSRSVLLSASAGSGKTRALRDRYLALLDVLDRHGLGIDQAVAITFTDKAAAEIRERVMQDLPGPLLKQVIRGRQDLRISTIHSFCMNLLKRYPLEAGLPPDFGVLDSRDQAAKVRKAIEDVLEISDRDPSIMSPLSGFTVDEMVGVIGFLISVRSRLKRMEIDAGGPDGLLRSVRIGMGMDAAEAEVRELLAAAEWQAALRTMEAVLKTQGNYYDDCMGARHLRLVDAADVDAAYALSEPLAPVYFTREGKPSRYPYIAKKYFLGNSGKDRKAYEDAFVQVQTLLDRFWNAYHRLRAGREALSMLTLYVRAEERYQRAKLREGLLDFDDLEIYAYRLLQGTGSPDILYWLDRKILHFLVDEFQDTSDIQWAILDKLTSEIFAGLGADKLMPPTLFVVGDEKQSIYRFREANYRLIKNVRQRMLDRLAPEAREVLTLDKNFRSTPEVIGTVNRVFAGLWGDAYQPSHVERTGQGSVRLIEVPDPRSDADFPGMAEAEVLAQEIRSLFSTEFLVPAIGRDQGEMRPATYDDCAILIQSRTRLKEYEAALQKAGIPFRVVGGIGFYEEDEVQAIMNALFFLWNPDDRLALASALKSALFGFSDADLYDLVRSKEGMLPALQTTRPEAWGLLHAWQQLAGLVPLATLIHTIIRDTAAYLRFGRLSRQAIFNIDKLLDTAREFDRRGHTTLQDFVEWVKNIQRTDQREATADMNLPGSAGSISILTVHKAKGLEYSVVFLPGMNQEMRSLKNGPEALITETKSGVRVAIKDPDNPLYDEMWKGAGGEQEELRQEHQRLLYVAMTRARDHLVMLGTLGTNGKPVKQNTWLDYLHVALSLPREQEEPADLRIRQYAYPSWQKQALGPARLPLQRPDDREAASAPDSAAVLRNLAPCPRSDSPEWKRATDLLSQDREDVLATAFAPSMSKPVSPLTRGNILHRCLEEHARTGAYFLGRVFPEFPDVLALDPMVQGSLEQDIKRVLDAVLRDPKLAWLFEQSDTAYSELPFLYKKGHAVISGIIDRVVIRNGRGFVIDYKSNPLGTEETVAALKEHYRPQIEVYCETVKELFRIDQVEGHLLFLDSARLERVV